jgi:hypothetical protein
MATLASYVGDMRIIGMLGFALVLATPVWAKSPVDAYGRPQMSAANYTKFCTLSAEVGKARDAGVSLDEETAIFEKSTKNMWVRNTYGSKVDANDKFDVVLGIYRSAEATPGDVFSVCMRGDPLFLTPFIGSALHAEYRRKVSARIDAQAEVKHELVILRAESDFYTKSDDARLLEFVKSVCVVAGQLGERRDKGLSEADALNALKERPSEITYKEIALAKAIYASPKQLTAGIIFADCMRDMKSDFEVEVKADDQRDRADQAAEDLRFVKGPEDAISAAAKGELELHAYFDRRRGPVR